MTYMYKMYITSSWPRLYGSFDTRKKRKKIVVKSVITHDIVAS